MKTTLVTIATAALLAVSGSASAQHHGQRMVRQWHPYHGWVWVAPLVIGGVIGYEAARNQQPVIVQQPVLVPPAPPVPGTAEVCSDWREVQTSDGRIFRERTCRGN